MNEPVEWQNYDQSSLPNLLRHDTWSWFYGLSIICGIDPSKSELFKPLDYYNIPYDEEMLFVYETGVDINELCYWKIQLLGDSPRSSRRTWYEDIHEYQAAIYDWDKFRDEYSDFPSPDGLTPDIADTSEKADNGRGGVSCQKEEITRRSSDAKRLPWRISLG
jgi:hypothetical protein